MKNKKEVVAIIGGTGNQGLGLAVRFAKAGYHVIIGSRSQEKAERLRDEANGFLDKPDVEGFENAVAASKADFVLITVPFQYLKSTLEYLKPHIKEGAIVIDVTVPLEFRKSTAHLIPMEKSGAEMAAEILDPIPVVAAFKSVSAHALRSFEKKLDLNVYVAGPKKYCGPVLELASALEDAQPIRVGPLSVSKYIEGLVPLSINVNKSIGSQMTAFRADSNPLKG